MTNRLPANPLPVKGLRLWGLPKRVGHKGTGRGFVKGSMSVLRVFYGSQEAIRALCFQLVCGP